jgi:hypothetical protein
LGTPDPPPTICFRLVKIKDVFKCVESQGRVLRPESNQPLT